MLSLALLNCIGTLIRVAFSLLMRTRETLATSIRALLLVFCLLLATGAAFGKLVAARDPRNGVWDAELVVIILQQSPNKFQVQEVFFGSASKGDSVELPGFRLFTSQQYGPDIVEPITADTRILLFLQHKKDAPAAWEPTYFSESFFWVQDPKQVTQLRNAANLALGLRQRWEKAMEISDPRRRAEALWPFLSWRDCGTSFSQHTKTALQSIGPAAGDYFVDQFDVMPHEDRTNLIRDAGAYGGDRLHDKLTAYVKAQQDLYESFLSTSGLDPKNAFNQWSALPQSVKDTYGDIYYGFAGIASFKRRDDLARIRDIAIWAVKYHLQQPSEVSISTFENMPDEANLPVISQIQLEFKDALRSDEVFHVDVIRALCAHKYSRTVPLLAPFVTDRFAGLEAERALSEIVGRDLGETPQPWLDWYKANYRHPP